MNWFFFVIENLPSAELIFIIIFIGYTLGKIKIFKISIGLSSIIVVSLIIGFYSSDIIGEDLLNNMRFLSSFGTSIFISAISVSAVNKFSFGIGRDTLFHFFIGAVMVLSAFGVFKIIEYIDINIDKSFLSGILCGALTTTPGLSSICEISEMDTSAVSLGYSFSYILGVLIIVIFVQITSRHSVCVPEKILSYDNKKKYKEIKIDTFLIISLVAFAGYIIGNVRIPLIDVSVGNSGGILLSGLILGTFTKKTVKMSFDENSLSFLRDFGLILFFIGTGISSGSSLKLHINFLGIFYGIIFSLVPIGLGYFLSVLKYGKRNVNTVVLVAGGMTSTPAICLLSEKKGVYIDVSSYFAAYIGALFTVTIGIRFL